MPVRQSTDGTTAARPPMTRAERQQPDEASHHGDSASSDCSGLSRP